MVEEVPQVCACLGHPSQDVSLVASSSCLSESWASKTVGMMVGQASPGWSRIFSFKSLEERRELMKAAVAWSSAVLPGKLGAEPGATVLLSGIPRIFTMASLVMLSYFLHSS